MSINKTKPEPKKLDCYRCQMSRNLNPKPGCIECEICHKYFCEKCYLYHDNFNECFCQYGDKCYICGGPGFL